jgi:ribosomal protein S18 acetylase RimI-like enzyme
LLNVFVDPEYRRMGAFTAMYDFIRAQAADAGAVIRLDVHKSNFNARRAYGKVGMRCTNEIVLEKPGETL